MKASHPVRLIASSILLLAGAASSQAQNGPDTLWEVTKRASMAGANMPATTHKVCGRGDQAPPEGPQDENCRISDVKSSNDVITYSVRCTGKDAMSGTGEMTVESDRYSGKFTLNGTIDGDAATMETEFSGKRVGKCTAK